MAMPKYLIVLGLLALVIVAMGLISVISVISGSRVWSATGHRSLSVDPG